MSIKEISVHGHLDFFTCITSQILIDRLCQKILYINVVCVTLQLQLVAPLFHSKTYAIEKGKNGMLVIDPSLTIY